MWFKDFTENEQLVSPAREVKPLLTAIFKKNRERILSDSIFNSLHFRYIMEFDDIKPHAKLPTEPTSLRALESDMSGAIALHELSLDKKKPKLLATKFGTRALSLFIEGVDKLKSMGFKESSGEIRHLSVPELNVEVIWLFGSNGGSNNFIRREPKSKELELKTEDQLMNELTQLKEEREKGGKGENGEKGNQGETTDGEILVG